MPRTGGNNPSPWIEKLILSYDVQLGKSSDVGRLNAHVTGVGQMSQSQALGSMGPIGLLILSDGQLQLPAVLTASAWEHLQEREDRESFSSLVNTTVCIQNYQLQFHMALEQHKCRFFLSVGELGTVAAGPLKDGTPCCRTMPSIRMKICEVWRTLSGLDWQSLQRDIAVDLSVLLWEWQDDYVQEVLEGVRERLTAAGSRPISPQPSTSGPAHSDTFTGTSWDADRIRYKGEKSFSVPIKCLLIPEEDAQQLPTTPQAGGRTATPPQAGGRTATPPQAGGRTPTPQAGGRTATPPQAGGRTPTPQAGGRTATPPQAGGRTPTTPQDGGRTPSRPPEDKETHVCQPPETVQTAVAAAAAEKGTLALPEEHEDMTSQIINSEPELLLDNPWDIFPPPGVSSSSPEASPPNRTAAKAEADRAGVLTSTQLPNHSPTQSQQTPELSKGEHSYFPPYQKPPHPTSLTATAGSSTSVSPPDPFTRPSNLSPATDKYCTNAAQQNLSALDMEETIERRYKKAKRKRSGPTSEEHPTPVEEPAEAAQTSVIPPSWLQTQETQAASAAGGEGSSQEGSLPASATMRKAPTVHSSGQPFSYTYQVSGHNLLDFSRFKVTDSLLLWALKYLVVPKQTDDPHAVSAAPDMNGVTKL